LAKRSFLTDFKIFFFRGLAAMLPVMLTLLLIVYVFDFIRKYVGKYLDVACQWAVIQFRWVLWGDGKWSMVGPDEQWDRIKGIWDANWLGVVGIVLSFVLIYFIGRFVASFIGRTSLRMLEITMGRLPVLRKIYPQVKQVTDYFFSDKRLEFAQVVALEYPRKGLWSIGLVTAGGMKKVADATGEELLTLFIPSSPTPFTGYTIMVPKKDVVDLPMSIDEAIRFTISGGVLQPQSQITAVGPAAKALEAPADDETNKETQA